MESTPGSPPPCQEKILEICNKNLQPHGVAYVSYNTYPGWHMRGMIRDLMNFHVRAYTLPAMKVKQARNLLDFLGKTAGRENTPFGLLLQTELEAFRRSSDSYLFHEHLEEVNEPLYFYQFMERATAKGLKYLGEADMRVMVPGNFPPEVENVLQILAQDMVHMEQYMDFIRNRMFRQTLLVHASENPNYNLRWEQMRRFHIASPAKPPAGENVDPQSPDTNKFETADGVTLNSSEPIVKAAMLVLAERWPKAIPFSELFQESRKRLGDKGGKDNEDEHKLGQAILTFYASASTSLVELWMNPPKFAAQAGEMPSASPWAREMAKTKNRVTNLRHESVGLGDFDRQLLLRLDGTRDRPSLVKELAQLVKDGELNVEKDGQPVPEEELGSIMGEAIEQQLRTMARSALLIS